MHNLFCKKLAFVYSCLPSTISNEGKEVKITVKRKKGKFPAQYLPPLFIGCAIEPVQLIG